MCSCWQLEGMSVGGIRVMGENSEGILNGNGISWGSCWGFIG